jgi:uncharacterized protein (DUF983 family)
MKIIGGFESLIKGRCPRCRKGHIFIKPILNPFSITVMNKKCPNCNLVFEKEPGFFNGAMYISYAFSVGLFLVTGFSAFYLLNDPPTWVYMTTIISLVILFFPYNFKYSRILMLYFFSGEKFEVKYH